MSAPPAQQTATMNWESVRKRLLSTDSQESHAAALELRDKIGVLYYSNEFPLLLSALLPAFSSILAHRTTPSPDTSSIDHRLRYLILDIISKMPAGQTLRPHAPHCVALCIDVLNRDYEDNALLASRIIFDLYKAYRSLPQDYVQPYLDFVATAYRSLPTATMQRNFAVAALQSVAAGTKSDAAGPSSSSIATQDDKSADMMEIDTPQSATGGTNSSDAVADKGGSMPMDTSESGATTETTASPTAITKQPSSPKKLALRASMSLRVLTESPLIVMLMFQLWPGFMKLNIPVLIAVMMDALAVRAPSYPSIIAQGNSQQLKNDATVKRAYYSRVRELVAAQAKTLSFVTYLLRSFSNELKPYEDRLATNVVTLMTICPRESIATRKELLVATRHLLNTDFRKGFTRHVDALLDERVLIGKGLSFSDQSLLRPLGFAMLSDLVQHVRSSLNMSQMTRIVLMFARALHDSTNVLPMSTQYMAVRTLLTMGDVITNNKDPNTQHGRDLLVRIFTALTEKLQALNRNFPSVLEAERKRAAAENAYANDLSVTRRDVEMDPLSKAPTDSVRDLQIMIRAIIVGNKSLIQYIHTYRDQHAKDDVPHPQISNEEVHSALQRLTQTEMSLIDEYILAVFPAVRLLKEDGPGSLAVGDKARVEHHREALTYFAATFTGLDGYYLARILGRRLDLMIDALVDDPVVMVFVRHLLGSNATTSLEFCDLLLNVLMQRMDKLASPRNDGVVFFDNHISDTESEVEVVKATLHSLGQRPHESCERKKRVGTTILQLFERILKSLAAFPENEGVVRKHLRNVVIVCFRSSMEQTEAWPDNYCMLLRYVFRAISAGKFEESYKELLPLLPTVLNGLYRVSVSDEAILRNTAVELCLTIPARLSSLLPHLNLLVRVIIPALDSNSGDLINLGLRTLEFWVDNLNPQFLYPEMTKQTELYASLMQSLSRHLRPAPYPYGLLTLRLLGKLGGNNREFLREPLPLAVQDHPHDSPTVKFTCAWPEQRNAGSFTLCIPLVRCLAVLEIMARHDGEPDAKVGDSVPGDPFGGGEAFSPRWGDIKVVLERNLAFVDFATYNKHVVDETLENQANACLNIVEKAIDNPDNVGESETIMHRETSILLCRCLLVAASISSVRQHARTLLGKLYETHERIALFEGLVKFLESRPLKRTSIEVGITIARLWLARDIGSMGDLLGLLCGACCSAAHVKGFRSVICALMDDLGRDCCRNNELLLINTAIVSIKSVPREMAGELIDSLRFFVHVCVGLYGEPWPVLEESEKSLLWDVLSLDASLSSASMQRPMAIADVSRPSDEVFRMVLAEIASPHHTMRLAARFMLTNYFATTLNEHESETLIQKNIPFIRRLLFSKALRLHPLPSQVAVVEGLACLVKLFSKAFSFGDQHFMSFLSELLKLASVADGEMTDKAILDCAVDKEGFALSNGKRSSHATHASGVFLRRVCVLDMGPARLVCPEELPGGVQMRVSGISLLHYVIKFYSDMFFDAESTTPVGNIRPHVVSLLFRSLVCRPARIVAAAHRALKDVLSLSLTDKAGDVTVKSQTRLPKELLQTCIRPVLLNLREHTRLTLPLLRGLARLLSLLSNWFNRTLGDKLLDHLQKWTDPLGIIGLDVWKGDEAINVAAAIVETFALLPAASHFVEALVKTCIRLEATLPVYKISVVVSPFRRPLAIYLNRHLHQTVGFFFPRLKTPTYSELFLQLLKMDETAALRVYLAEKQCSVMLLNICFERPLAVVRQDKATESPATKDSLYVHGIGSRPGGDRDAPDSLKHMDISSQECQIIGLRLVNCLSAHDQSYFSTHGDIVRAFRWLWRSRGRLLRMQHEQYIAPRYHGETKYLAAFLMSYAKSFPDEGLDILFELVRGNFLSSTNDCTPVIYFIKNMVRTLSITLKRQVVQRFFALLAGDGSDDTKVLSVDYILIPMLEEHFKHELPGGVRSDLVDVEVFVKDILSASLGDRLRASLFLVCHLLLINIPSQLESYRTHLVKFCWGQLKSDDYTCKGWSHLLLCVIIKSFNVPSKVVQQVYGSLLKASQQEARDLIRSSADVLLPCLCEKLPQDLYAQTLNQTSKVMLDEGSSTLMLAHMCQMLVRSADVFASHKELFISHLVNALGKLALPPNLENRIVSVSVVEVLLLWTGATHLETLLNFLVRLKMLVAEKIENVTSSSLEQRISRLLTQMLSQITTRVDILVLPLDRALRESTKTPSSLLAAIQVLCIIAEAGQLAFFIAHDKVVCELVRMCLSEIKDEPRLIEPLRRIASACIGMHSVATAFLVSIDELLQTYMITKKVVPVRITGRNRDAESGDPAIRVYLEIVLALCRQRGDRIKLVDSSLLSVASQLVDTLNKQRQSSYSKHHDYHSPTMGIIQGACLPDTTLQSKARDSKDEPILVILVLEAFWASSGIVPYNLSQGRKALFHLIVTILDNSDRTDLLIAAGRMARSWLLSDSPMTAIERNNFLLRLCSGVSASNLADITAQAFIDFIVDFIEQLHEVDPVTFDRSIMFCLLSPQRRSRDKLFRAYFDGDNDPHHDPVVSRLSKLTQSNYEAIGSRFWPVIFVDGLLDLVLCDADLSAVSLLAHGDATTCQCLLEQLMSGAWDVLPGDGFRVRMKSHVENMLSRVSPSQFLKDDSNINSSPQNTIRSFLKAVCRLRPAPVFDNHVVVYSAENYNAWHEALELLERQYHSTETGKATLQAIRHCYHHLEEQVIKIILAKGLCSQPLSQRAIFLEVTGFARQAVDQYEDLVELVESTDVNVTDFEAEFWQERWATLQRDLDQTDAVKEFVKGTNSHLELEMSWKTKDWNRVRTLTTNDMLSSIEAGDPIVKMAETILCVAEGKLSDVENLHAQSAQLALHKWQLLPQLSGGSNCHALILHLFHRLVEVREAGQVMVESANHSSGKSLPDLKNLLSAWRHRLPLTSDGMTFWTDIVACRCFIYESICTKFRPQCDNNTLAGLHDRPWTLIRMAKAARKQGLSDVSLRILNRAVDPEGAMSVSDAFFKLREQVLVYHPGLSDVERHGSLNMLNTTNLSFFDTYQKSELFRIKALFLASLGSRSKANQACCHAAQICSMHGRAWETWGSLCSSLASMTDKAGGDGSDPKTTSKKVAQYLAQAMGCYLEAVSIDSHEWARAHLPKCLYMLSKDGDATGVLCATLEGRGSELPPWVWLPWLSQLLTSFCRSEGRAIKAIFEKVAKAYPQAVYYSLRTFYLERRDAERAKNEQSQAGHMQSVALAEEMMSLLRRSHTYLWSALESILEELIVKFRPTAEEELLSPILALLERAEAQQGSSLRSEDESTSLYIWKTIWRISAKFFKDTGSPSRQDDKANKMSVFKDRYKEEFEIDFNVSSLDSSTAPPADARPPMTLVEFTDKLTKWKRELECNNAISKSSISKMIDISPALASYAAGDVPGLWSGSCDSKYASSFLADSTERGTYEHEQSISQSTSSSVTAARKAAATAAAAAAAAAVNEGVGGDYGGGSAAIEIPGQYVPNTSEDGRPRVELHAKLTKFYWKVELLRRGDQLVRRIYMIGSDGKDYSFLVQAAVPYWTRAQERSTQFQFVLAKYLRKDLNASKNHYSIQNQPIVALAQRLRLVSEPAHVSSLEEVIHQRCLRSGRDINLLSLQFSNAVRVANDFVPDSVDSAAMYKEKRLRAFHEASLLSKHDDSALREHVHAILGGAEELFSFRRTFSQQWAANCLMQYAFSVVERTPCRVSFINSTGAVLSPDFRASYNAQGFLDSVNLPFRLTANLCNLIAFPLLDGRFAVALSIISNVARSFKADLAPVIKLLMRDDLLAFYTRSMPKSDTKTQEMEKQLKDRFSTNSAVILGRLGECAPIGENDTKVPMDARVSELISLARDPEKLSKMQGSYQAWL